MYYSFNTGGFYSSEFHTSIPSDAVQLSDIEYQSLIDGLANGNQIVRTPDGRPKLEPIVPTSEQLIVQKMQESHQYLKDTDFYYARFSETGEPVPADVVSKRKEARDFIRGNS